MSNLQPTAAASNEESSSRRESTRFSQSDIHVADGFRPPATSNPPREATRPTPSRSFSTPFVSSEQRNSTSKDVGMAVSDESISPVSLDEQPFDPNTSRFITRSSSSASIETTGSPYHSRISRISFSYPRRPSTATPTGSRPAHPYALYQQTTFEEPEDEEEEEVATPPVGFPGRSVNFRRRIGPDGEELDVIGPDGHAEQLPPYTRYPEAGPLPAKQAAQATQVARAAPAMEEGEASSVAQVSPLIGATVLPPEASTSSISSSSSHRPSQPSPLQTSSTFLAMGHSQPQPSPVSQTPTSLRPPTHTDTNESRAVRSSASSLAEEKRKNAPPEGWGRKKSRKILCGTVPVWAVVLFAVLCVIIAVIAGGVIGGMMSNQQKERNRHRNSDENTVTVTNHGPMFDAAPIPTPTGLPPLPTGTFFFPLGAPGEQERRCIEPSRDSTAWSCGVTNQLLLIDFGKETNSRNPIAKIYPAPPAAGMNDSILYGAQPPKITTTQRLVWVKDLRDEDRGPALHFQTTYDKIIIIEGDKFPSPELHLRSLDLKARNKRAESPVKRDYNGPPPSMSSHSSPALHRFADSPGEQPWYCFWNQTFIEGFIYIQQPIPGAETQEFTASRPSTESTYPTPYLSASPSSAPDQTSLSSSIMIPDATPSPMVSARAILARTPAKPSSITLPPTVAPQPVPAPTDPPSRFPFLIKIEERRLPNPAFTPFCQRFRILPNGVREPQTDEHGNKVVEIIKEAPGGKTDAQVTAGVAQGTSNHQKKGYQSNGGAGSEYGKVRRRQVGEWEMGYDGNVVRRNAEPSNSCHCQWVSPYG
ncbi:hypothetical protein BT63DRAFT_475702 [Microthyrium microscopicum]|uniref:DUF7820 domain-containing protein n=1 Tax=Microthyrium microscopicum TaxID=703497 RepID=A0A6A6UNV9_9PEZI|nr:hypothetical protein BT63DRAFT_475702 [Microthyrium microscopicum]